MNSYFYRDYEYFAVEIYEFLRSSPPKGVTGIKWRRPQNGDVYFFLVGVLSKLVFPIINFLIWQFWQKYLYLKPLEDIKNG